MTDKRPPRANVYNDQKESRRSENQCTTLVVKKTKTKKVHRCRGKKKLDRVAFDRDVNTAKR